MLGVENFVEAFKIITTVAIFFVWFVRYDNIKKEFLEYGYPTWFRDLVGVLKISLCVMLHSSSDNVVIIGAVGISILMIGAVFTHLKMKSTFRKYIASVAMLSVAVFIIFFTM